MWLKGSLKVAQRLLTETFYFHRFSIFRIYYLPTECDGGMFGKYCNESCGKCFNDGQCHHINGSCLNGCDSGYHGINCTYGILSIFDFIHTHIVAIDNFFGYLQQMLSA